MNFLQELEKLLLEKPKHYCPRQDNENSDYSAFTYRCKNSYMVFASDYLEDCMYVMFSFRNKDCLDLDWSWDNELCYEGVDLIKCYNCDFCRNCENLVDCFFCESCFSCQNCFGCSGLRKAQYYIFNEKYSRDEYQKRLPELKKKFAKKDPSIKEKFEKLLYSMPHVYAKLINCEDCVGNHLINCKNCFYTFDTKDSEDCIYLMRDVHKVKDCVDCCHIHESELCYNLMSSMNAYNCNNCFWCINSSNCEYCFCINDCKNCFGCVNLRYKEYCILNKQYSPEEYQKKVAEIKKDLKEKGLYGQFLLDTVYKPD